MRTRHVPVRFMAFFAAIAAMLVVIGPVDAIADAASPSDVTWNFNPSQNSNLVAYEGTSGTIYDESRDNVMNVDATNGKFSPRESDTQVNADTTLSFTAQESSDGATVTVNLSGGSTAFTVTVDNADQETYNGSGSVSFDVPAGGG